MTWDIKRTCLGQNVTDRLDLAARIYWIQPRAQMKFEIDKKVFGDVTEYLRGIEFQEQSLPHVHYFFS